MSLFNECLWQPFLLVQEADLWAECKHYEILWFTLKLTYNLCCEAENIFQFAVGKPSGKYSFATRFQHFSIIVFCHSIVTFTARFEIFSLQRMFLFFSNNSREIISFFVVNIANYYFVLWSFVPGGKLLSKKKHVCGSESRCHHRNYDIVRTS